MSAISSLRSLPLRTIMGVLVTGYFVVLYLNGTGDGRYVLMVILFCLFGTWRSHIRWSRMKRQKGVELLGTDAQ